MGHLIQQRRDALQRQGGRSALHKICGDPRSHWAGGKTHPWEQRQKETVGKIQDDLLRKAKNLLQTHHTKFAVQYPASSVEIAAQLDKYNEEALLFASMFTFSFDVPASWYCQKESWTRFLSGSLAITSSVIVCPGCIVR